MKAATKPEIRYRVQSFCTCDCHDGKGLVIWHERCSDLHSSKPRSFEITEEQFQSLANTQNPSSAPRLGRSPDESVSERGEGDVDGAR